MSIAFVQGVENTPSASSMTLDGVTSGNLLVMSVTIEGASAINVISMTDNMLNSWTKSVQIAGANGIQDSEFWYAPNVTGGNITVTITYNIGGSFPAVRLMEFSGAATVSPIRSFASATDTGNIPAPPALTTAATSDMLIENLYVGDVCRTTAAPWTDVLSDTCFICGYYIPGSIGSFSLAFAPADADDWTSTGIVVKSAGGGGPSGAVLGGMNLVF